MKSTLDPKVGVVGGQVQAKLGGTIAIYASCGDRSSTLYFKPGRMENTLENRLKGPPVKSAYVFTMEVVSSKIILVFTMYICPILISARTF